MDADGLFGHVNDAIRSLATEDQAGEVWEFFCECRDLGCHALVSLSVVEFDARRSASPPIPVVAAGHDGLDVRRGAVIGTTQLG